MSNDVVSYTGAFVECVERRLGACSRQELYTVVEYAIAAYNRGGGSWSGGVGGGPPSVDFVAQRCTGRICFGGVQGVDAVAAADRVEGGGGGETTVGGGGEERGGLSGAGECGDVGLVEAEVCSEVAAARGPNYERNRANREKAKRRKLAKQARVPEWRRGAASNAVRDAAEVRPLKASAFDGCDEKKRGELRETQLDMLIAKNRWEATQYGRKMESVAAYGSYNKMRGVVQQAELEKRLMEATKNRKTVQGWAETVLSAPGTVSDMASTHSRLVGSGLVTPNSSVSVEAAEAKWLAEVTTKVSAEVTTKVSAEVEAAMSKKFRDLKLVMRGYTQ